MFNFLIVFIHFKFWKFIKIYHPFTKAFVDSNYNYFFQN